MAWALLKVGAFPRYISKRSLLMRTRLSLFALFCVPFAGGCSPDDSAANEAVDSVIIVGTNVTKKVYETGEYGLTLLPRDAAGAAVLSDGLAIDVSITSPPGLFTSEVLTTHCAAAVPGAGLSVGVIIDDSGSMGSSDPQLRRRDAAVAFIDAVGGAD